VLSGGKDLVGGGALPNDRFRGKAGTAKLEARGLESNRSKAMPSIRVLNAEAGREDLAAYLKEATRFIGALPDPLKMDMRGDRFGIEGFGSMSYLRVEWEVEGPPEWAKTVTRISRLRSLLIASSKLARKCAWSSSPSHAGSAA